MNDFEVAQVLRHLGEKIESPSHLTVRIVSVGKPSYWYADEVGSVYEVIEIEEANRMIGDKYISHSPSDYCTLDSVKRFNDYGVGQLYLIDKQDCEVLT